jgi:DNA-binding beta-propeller fold protein YncE
MHTFMKLRFSIVFLALFTSLLASAETSYSIQQKWSLSGGGGWGALFVDASSHRLYVPRTDRVSIIDTATGQETGEIRGVIDARSIALDASGKFGYITDIADGKTGFVRVFDRSTNQVVSSIPTGKLPDAVVYDALTNTVAVFSRYAHSVLLLNADTNQSVASVQLPGLPSNAVTDGKGSVFVTIENKNEIARIDIKQARSTAEWALQGCTAPTGLAMDTTNKRLFTLCENKKLIVLRSTNGTRMTSIATGAGPGTVSYDPQRKLIFVADGAGQLTLIQPKSPLQYAVMQTLDIMPGSHVLAVDGDKDRAYLVAAEYGQRTDGISEELQLRPAPASGKCSVVVVGR